MIDPIKFRDDKEKDWWFDPNDGVVFTTDNKGKFRKDIFNAKSYIQNPEMPGGGSFLDVPVSTAPALICFETNGPIYIGNTPYDTMGFNCAATYPGFELSDIPAGFNLEEYTEYHARAVKSRYSASGSSKVSFCAEDVNRNHIYDDGDELVMTLKSNVSNGKKSRSGVEYISISYEYDFPSKTFKEVKK